MWWVEGDRPSLSSLARGGMGCIVWGLDCGDGGDIGEWASIKFFLC